MCSNWSHSANMRNPMNAAAAGNIFRKLTAWYFYYFSHKTMYVLEFLKSSFSGVFMVIFGALPFKALGVDMIYLMFLKEVLTEAVIIWLKIQ